MTGALEERERPKVILAAFMSWDHENVAQAASLGHMCHFWDVFLSFLAKDL